MRIKLFPLIALLTLTTFALSLTGTATSASAQNVWVTGAELYEAGQAQFNAYSDDPGLGIFAPSMGWPNTACENSPSVLPSEEFINGESWEHFIVIDIDPPVYANKLQLTGMAVDYDSESQRGREPSYEVGFNHDEYRYNFTGAMGNECQTNEFAFLPRLITNLRLYCVDVWRNTNPEKCGFHGFSLLTEVPDPIFTVFLPLVSR